MRLVYRRGAVDGIGPYNPYNLTLGWKERVQRERGEQGGRERASEREREREID